MTLAMVEDFIRQKCSLAIRYAQAGKHSLAKRQLRNAQERADSLNESDGAALSDTLASQLDRTEQELTKLGTEIASAPNPEKVPKLVLIFGLSANPPTGMGGHAGIVQWAASSLKIDIPNDTAPAEAFENVSVSEVWVLPVYRHAFRNKSNLQAFEHRMAMAKLAFENLPGLQGRVLVKDYERQLAQRHAHREERGAGQERLGSIDLIEMLQDEFPQLQFVLAFGGDTYRDYIRGLWKGGRKLEERVPLVVIPRSGVPGIEGSEESSPQLTDVSSTEVRNSRDHDYLGEVLQPEVLAYIEEHRLYGFGAQ